MRAFTYLLIASFLFHGFAIAQRDRTINWYFGSNAGLKFQPNVHADTLGQVVTDEGCAAISDSCGQLLFYTDGSSIFNRLHNVMDNGTGLPSGISTSQGALIIPKPLSNHIYYLFSTAGPCTSGGYFYSEIDMSLNGGLGKVISKNNYLHNNFMEKQAAVNHCNNTDVWALTKIGNDVYSALLVTSAGINTTAVESTINAFCMLDNNFGYMKFSPDGKYLADAYAYAGDSVKLHKFNDCTGIVSPFLTIPFDSAVYGLSFSPNSSKLYVCNGTNYTGNASRVYQYDLSSGSPTQILSSKTLVYTAAPGKFYGAMQIGPDNKIYITKYGSVNYDVEYLSVIAKPDLQGMACTYLDDNIYLNSKKCKIGLPLYNESYFKTGYSCFANIGFQEIDALTTSLTLYPNPANARLKIRSSYHNLLTEFTQVEIRNDLGELVRKETSDLTSSETEINTKDLANGIYFLILKNYNNICLKKSFIVEH